jgi:hypothetical protein
MGMEKVSDIPSKIIFSASIPPADVPITISLYL